MKQFVKNTNIVREETFDLINFSRWEKKDKMKKGEKEELRMIDLIKK